MMKKILAFSIATLMLAAAPAFAGQSASGTILLPNPGSDSVGGVNELAYVNAGIEMNGVDGHIIHLDDAYTEFTLTGDAGVLGECDLDAWFYDAQGGLLDGYTNTFDDCNEGGDVPAGATTAVINMWYGFNVNFEFEAS